MAQKILFIIVLVLFMSRCDSNRRISKIEIPQAKPTVKAENAKFYIETDEKNLGKQLNPKVLKMKMEQLMADNGLSVVYRVENANYIIKVFTNTSKQKKENNMCFSLLTGEIKIYDTLHRLVWFIK